jgi:exosortase
LAPIPEDDFYNMEAPALKDSGTLIASRDKWLLGLLLLSAGLAYHDLILWETKADFLPNVVGSYFYLSGTSPQFLYVLVLGLLVVRRKLLAHAFHAPGAPWSGGLFLLSGAGLLLWGHYVGANDIVHVSFILAGLGVARLLSGKALTRAIRLPVLILVLATPLPAVLVNQIVFPFQLWDAIHTTWLLNLIGIPSMPKGDIISMAEDSFWVAESCTALGFTKWLMIFALAYAYLFPVSRWHTVLLVLSSVVIAYSVNLMRIMTLVLNPKMDVLSVHTVQGIVFFLIGFSLLYAVDSLFLRFTGKNAGPDMQAAIDGTRNINPGQKRTRLWVLVAVFASLFVATAVLPRWPAPPTGPVSKIELAEELGQWKLVDTPKINSSFLGSVRYSSHLHRDYARGQERVFLFIGDDDRRRRYRSLLSEKNAYPGAIGLVEERGLIELDPGGPRILTVVTDTDIGRLMTWHWYEGSGSATEETLRALLALDQSPFRREADARVLRLTTNVERRSNGRADAEARLRGFLRDLNEALAEKTEPGV